MANLTQIELPNGTTYDIEDAKKKGVYVVKGTHTTATVAWTGAIDVDALYDGLTIVYYLPISATSGSTQVTLNLTLSGGTTTGAINCYYNASKLTRSYYPAGSSILMTYWSAGSISISGTATTAARWIAGADYNANTWRNITIDGTQAYSTSTSSGALALISGTNVNIASDGGAPAKVTISATDTNTIAGMTDVQLTSPTDNDLLVYDSNLSGGKLWKNAKKIVTCTQAQFDNWVANNSFPYTDCKYIVTDAPNTNGTSEDLSYDGGVTSTHDVIADIITNYGFEEDSSGVWTWRKWNNGTLELWGDSNEIYSGTFNVWGNVYSLDVAGLGNYPVTFTRIDFMTGSCCLGGANGAGTLTNTSDGLSGIAPGYIIVRGTNVGATDRNLYKTLYVKGKWK